LRKIPVLRLNFTRLSAREMFVSRLVFFANTLPKDDISVQNTYMVLFNILHLRRRAVLFNYIFYVAHQKTHVYFCVLPF
jgi:hypothetical protein